MASIFVGLGSNTRPQENIDKAITQIEEFCDSVEESPCYLSPAVGKASGEFANMVIAAQTDLSPHALVARLKAIEYSCARSTSEQTIDLDLLLYDDLQMVSGDVRVPREDIELYPFVLKPLSELAPDLIHPQLNKTLKEMWRESDFNDAQLKPVQRASLD
ncbi:MAG: 2-amino-4-hydroxy-6-hydroxymethyldihydropteridine diphosphokinase [Pseudomonadota bacterium]